MTLAKGYRYGGRLLVVLAALFVLSGRALGNPAGTVLVYTTPSVNSPATGCNLFTVWGDTFDYLYNPPCNGAAMGMGFPGGTPAAPHGARIGYQVVAPAGMTIAAAIVSNVVSLNVGSAGWGGGSYYAGGGHPWGSDTSYSDGFFSSNYWGFQLICENQTGCGDGAELLPGAIEFAAVENQGPGLLAVGANNLWYQGDHYVWNAPGDPWPITLSASSPSGICDASAIVDGTPVQGPLATPNQSQWHQCPDVTWEPDQGAAVDTTQYVPGSGPLPLTFTVRDAAQYENQVSESLSVDNVPVTVNLTTPDDQNPELWVNHPVTVDAQATAGPSGVAGVSCGTDGATGTAYPATGVTVDGDGTHTVQCTAWNNAVNPQGQPNSGTRSVVLHIDETPPWLAFEPQNPDDPTALVVDTHDGESGVASGTIQVAPAGTNDWTSLPTSFDGAHLLARFDDASLSGPYVFRAASCDGVGNCTSADEELALPVRLRAISDVSFSDITPPQMTKKVRERVRVGWHWVAVLRHGKAVKVKRGGHWKTITVIRPVEKCTEQRTKVGRRRWTIRRTCSPPKLRLRTTDYVGHGLPATLHGLLLTSQGVPLAGQSIRILAAPDNGSSAFGQIASATTGLDGRWTAVIPPGPSRLLQAVYDGSNRVAPAVGTAHLNVPAKITIHITPRAIPWSGFVTIRGSLRGGYVPPDGVALRLLVRYPGAPLASPLLALRTNRRGSFAIKWTYHAGRGRASYPFWISTTATESDYPFAPASSRHVRVRFG